MPTRRQYLGLVAAGGGTAAVISGALVSAADDDEPTVPDEASISTIDSDCGGPDPDDVSVTIYDDAVDLIGSIGAPTPCYEAVIEAVNRSGSDLEVHIDVESTLEEGNACVECVGELAYEATIPIEESVVDVTVFHGSDPVAGTD